MILSDPITSSIVHYQTLQKLYIKYILPWLVLAFMYTPDLISAYIVHNRVSSMRERMGIDLAPYSALIRIP